MEQLGKYEILGRIGEGGFGTVWKGRDPFLKRTVAIKTCTSENEELRKRFLREAEIAGGLHHVNVTVVHDFGYHEGVPFLVQEFLTGEDLSSIIRRKDAVPQATKLRWLLDVARGLEYAHGKGVVHRDVKPANVRIIDGGTAKVMDFGIAKLAEMNTNQLTKTGTAMGTIGYMAPEQVNGQPVDHRADIFAYGVLAYELLTYERPFEADTMSRVFYRILHEEPKPLSELIPLFPADLERVVLRCLAKDPHHRYGSFRAVLADLERIVEGRPIEDVPEGDATAIDNPAFRPTELVDAAPRPSGPTRIVSGSTGATRAVPPTGPTAMVGAPDTATGYAPPSGRRLSTALIAAAVIGGVIAGSAVLLVGGKREPEAAATAPAATPVAPAADPAEGRARARVLVAEAERLIAEGRPSAALEVAIDAVSLDPDSARARELIEELAEQAPARPAAAPVTPSPSPAAPRPSSVAAAPAPAPATPVPATATPASAAAPVATMPTSEPISPSPAPAPAPSTDAPSPAPASAPAVDPTAAAEAAVRDLLARYANAYERLDAAAVAALWPTIGAERQRGLAQAFANYKWLEMDLEGCAIALTGETATADCRMRQTYELKVGKAEPRDAAVRFKLRQSGGAWKIDDVGGR
jgi:serine/threonine-protein kinase